MIDIVGTLELLLMSEAISVLPLYIVLKFRQKWIERKIMSLIGSVMLQFLAKARQDPAFVEKHVSPFITQILSSLKNAPVGGGGGREGGIRLPFIGRLSFSDISTIVDIIDRFRGGAVEKKANPFG